MTLTRGVFWRRPGRVTRITISSRWLVAFFTAVVSCFVGSTIYTHVQARDIDALARSIGTDALPSMRHLAAARMELRHVQELIGRYATADAPEQGAVLSSMMETQKRLKDEIQAYLALPIFPGEELLWQSVRDSVNAVQQAIEQLREATDRGDAASIGPAVSRLRRAMDDASIAVWQVVDFNAARGQEAAERIGLIRNRSLLLAFLLDGLSVLLTAGMAVALVRSLRREARSQEEHNDLLVQRAAELEQFAGRVAHDIRNPLSAVSLGIDVLERSPLAQDPKTESTLARARRSMRRANQILDALLEFARAGARPKDGVRADVNDVMEELFDEFVPAAALAQIELVRVPSGRFFVACDPGILAAVVSNLLRNAIKYMEGDERRIVVRMCERAGMVRVEVKDTGPGVPGDLRQAIFEPFVRGMKVRQEGVGLGLATVKRVCEAHGGRVGVTSDEGSGSCFWIELPAAPTLEQEQLAGSWFHRPQRAGGSS